MKIRDILTAISVGMLITGCSLIPSRWDDNEAAGVTDLYNAIVTMDCTLNPVLLRHVVEDIDKKHSWVLHYTQLKGTKDIESLLLQMDGTIDSLVEKETISPTYCKLKQKVLTEQSFAVADTIMGRFK